MSYVVRVECYSTSTSTSTVRVRVEEEILCRGPGSYVIIRLTSSVYKYEYVHMYSMYSMYIVQYIQTVSRVHTYLQSSATSNVLQTYSMTLCFDYR